MKRFPLPLFFLLLTALPHLLFMLSKWYAFPLDHGVPSGTSDPDPWLRMVLVRDWLVGGDWYSHLVPGTNAPFGGITSPWTRPLDMVIAALVYLQPESVELNLRIFRAALLLPWIWMTLLIIGVYRIVRLSNAPSAAYLMASLLIATTPMIWNYFGPANADHHAPLAVLFIWVIGTIIQAKPSRTAIILSGAMLSLQLWMSVEALVLIAAIYVWYGLNWLLGEQKRATPLPWLATSVAASTALALLIERASDEWFRPLYDTISIAHVFALTMAAIVALALDINFTRDLRKRIGVATVISITGLAVIYTQYPLLFANPMVEAGTFILTQLMPKIIEAEPFYNIPLMAVLSNLILPVVALLITAAAWFSPKQAFYSKTNSAALFYLVAVTLGLYLTQQRWSYYLLPLAVAVVAPVLGAIFSPSHRAVVKRWPARIFVRLSEEQQVSRRLPILVLLAGLPLLLAYLSATCCPATLSDLLRFNAQEERALLADEERQDTIRNTCYAEALTIIHNGELVRALGNERLTLLAPSNIGAAILFFTPYHIIASNYHREGTGIQFAWAAYDITDPEKLRTHLATRDVNAVLICPSSMPTNSVLVSIANGGEAPKWLERVMYQHPTLPLVHSEKMGDAHPVLLRVIY